MDLKQCWLTLNRACNLRCVWCYASTTKYKYKDKMEAKIAKQIIDICDEANIKRYVLIGGEPTLYNDIFDVIDYIHNKKAKATIVTNGIMLAKEKYLDKLIEHNIDGIGISLKGETPDIFKNITGYDMFNEVIEGIKNCLNRGIKISVSMVLTEDNIPSFISAIEKMYKIGVKKFHLSFCYEMEYNEEYKVPLTPSKIISKFISYYEELNNSCEGNFHIFNGYPLCLRSKDFLRKICKREQFRTVCQLLTHKGIVFDTDGTILPCNAMTSIKMGKINIDFNDFESFKKHIESEEIEEIYNELRAIPDVSCLKCEALKYCGGGCVCNWTKYSFKDLKDRGEIIWVKK